MKLERDPLPIANGSNASVGDSAPTEASPLAISYWGQHLVIDCTGCNRKSITNPITIANFAKELVRRIEMVAYGEPQVVHFGDKELAGYTLIQLIETSNITAHFCDESGDAYIDVFSCKAFDNDVVKYSIEEYFSPATMYTRTLNRGYATEDRGTTRVTNTRVFTPREEPPSEWEQLILRKVDATTDINTPGREKPINGSNTSSQATPRAITPLTPSNATNNHWQHLIDQMKKRDKQRDFW
jgi:S-adenosylmethionine/arginine decarboxylase-like enzyme